MVISGPWHVDPGAATGDRRARPRRGPRSPGSDAARRCGRHNQNAQRGRPAFGSAVCPATSATSTGERKSPGQAVRTPAASTTPVPGSRRLADLRCAGRWRAARGVATCITTTRRCWLGGSLPARNMFNGGGAGYQDRSGRNSNPAENAVASTPKGPVSRLRKSSEARAPNLEFALDSANASAAGEVRLGQRLDLHR